MAFSVAKEGKKRPDLIPEEDKQENSTDKKPEVEDDSKN